MRLVETLLASGDRVLMSPRGGEPMWLRATSLVYRGAVEAILEELWATQAPRMLRAPRRVQLACLPSWMEPATARELTLRWNELSEMAHHRLDAGPDPGRVRRAGQAVREVAVALGHLQRSEGPVVGVRTKPVTS